MKPGARSDTPLVSVVIPTTGRRELAQAVASVAAQSVAHETIVVLDRPEAAEGLRERLTGADCRVVQTTGRIGSSAARNLGIDLARGRFIAFCDDDDWWEPTKLARQLTALQAGAGGRDAVVTCAMVFHRRDGQTEILPRREPRHDETLGDYLVSRSRVRFGDGVVQTSCLLAPAALLRQTRFDARLRLHEDWDLVIRLTEDAGARLVAVPEPLAHVQQGSRESLSAAGDWRESRRWLDRHGGRLSATATGDFFAVQIMRAALARRDPAGVRFALRGIARNRPHRAALLLAGLGVIGR